MIVRYKEQVDKRVTKKRSFAKEYLIILSIMLICCVGAILMYDKEMTTETTPWLMAASIGPYILFMVLLICLSVRYIIKTGFMRPLSEFGQAAKKVAEGDFTVRIQPKVKEGGKDEMDIFIEDFNKMVEELATIETLKGDFISNISHELKTPLAIIQSYALALRKDELLTEEKDNYIKTIVDASKKLSELVSNVLRLNKLDSQEIIIKETFALDEQLRQCIVALEEKFDEKNIELDIELEEALIISDPGLLEMVWNNLLTNAIKFTPENGRIRIYLRKNNEKIEVVVEDTGCGMEEKTLLRIFDRFYQGDTSHSIDGNGLGLSLVQRILNLVDGQISVVSEVGGGSKFTVTL
jgi:signal transduction histidine kinase